MTWKPLKHFSKIAGTIGVCLLEDKGNVPMVNIPNEIIEKVQMFIHSISASGLHIERAILFGSYTKGTANKWSDIDLALVSKDFTGFGFYDRKRVNPHLIKIDSRIEPHPFRPEDFTEDNPFVNEILKDAIEITLNSESNKS